MKTRSVWTTTLLLTLACEHGGSGWGMPDEATDSASADGGSGASTSSESTTGLDEGTDAGVTEGTSDDGPSPTCEPLGELDPRRVLIETRSEVLASVSLRDVLTAIAVNAGLPADPQDTHDRLFDTYRIADGAEYDGAHCDDELIGGQPSLNGYPLLCPRSEGAFAAFDAALDGWVATAFVNRLDLAPEDGSHCGEQRIVFANPNMVGRAFIIFEAQIPNPTPACGVASCAPIAELWARLDEVSDPVERSQRLRAAFLDGDESLAAAGFDPFMSADHLTFGTGQVRTNNFVTGPWTLRQYELVAHDDGDHLVLRPEPVPVSGSPSELLWNDLVEHPAGPSCREAMLDALPGLLVDDVASMGWSLPDACRNSESVEFLDAYDDRLLEGSGSFAAAIEARVQALRPGSTLGAVDVARRARFAGSCIGCHEHAGGLSLGEGLVAPASLGFVHVDESLTEPCGDGSECFAISPALEHELLPQRLEALVSVRAQGCESACVAASSAPAHGLASFVGTLDEDQRRALDRAATPRGWTIGGRPANASH